MAKFMVRARVRVRVQYDLFNFNSRYETYVLYVKEIALIKIFVRICDQVLFVKIYIKEIVGG